MSRSNRLVSGCFWLILSLAGNSHAVEILHWQRLPLTVPLHVDEERVIFVNRDVRVGVPASGYKVRAARSTCERMNPWKPPGCNYRIPTRAT